MQGNKGALDPDHDDPGNSADLNFWIGIDILSNPKVKCAQRYAEQAIQKCSSKDTTIGSTEGGLPCAADNLDRPASSS